MDYKLIKMPIAGIKPHPNNPRTHPESALIALAKSIEAFGWTNPIIMSKDGFVLAGHARLKAAQQAGITEVPVIQTELEGARAEAYMIADNRLQELTEWDMPILKDLLLEMDSLNIPFELTGFTDTEVEGLMTQFHIDDEHNMDAEKKANKCPQCGYTW